MSFLSVMPEIRNPASSAFKNLWIPATNLPE
jgi:hypothetical protein